MKKVISVLWCCLPLFGFAQVVEAFWEKNPTEVGEITQLTVQISSIKKQKINYTPFPNKIICRLDAKDTLFGEIEQIKPFKIKKSTSVWLGKYTVIPWDTGKFILPLLTVQIADSIYKLVLPNLQVKYTKPDVNEDIEEWFSELPLYINPYVVVCLVLLAIVIFIWWRKRKKKQLYTEQLNYKEKALQDLKELGQQKLWFKKEYKVHFERFSFIFRVYLSARYQLPLMERTTQEAVLLLRSKGVDNAVVRAIEHLLSLSDFAKFAGAEPTDEQVESALNQAIDWIEEQQMETEK